MALQFFQIQPESSFNWSTLISALTLILGVSGATAAWFSYRNAEKWKKAEFLANEMERFFDDPMVRNACLMIDWYSRRIHLFDKDERKGKTTVTRATQIEALMPNVVPRRIALKTGRFTTKEAAIRDCYDALLDGLERFSIHLDSDLILKDNLSAYLSYWISCITEVKRSREEREYRATLLTYIDYYGFRRVQKLFADFGKPIDRKSKFYSDLLSGLEDRQLADAFQGLAKTK